MTHDATERSRQVRVLVDDYLGRRARGEAESREAFLAAHSEFASELKSELETLAIIDRAWGQSHESRADFSSDESSGLETLVLVRCPNCQTRVETDGSRSLMEVCCASCGQKFELVGIAAADSFPNVIGRFELLEKLGSGSFGSVWRARDLKLDREVALKIPRRRSANAQAVEDVLHEARVAAQLKHRHIVAIHEVDWQGENPYIVSDLISGETLDAWAKKNSPSFRDAAELCCTIAEALDHAHHAGVVHRDLKPANILIDHRGEPHLTDFGLAKRAGDELAMTSDGQMLGTPAYMSPEQARGTAHLCDRRSDVYSLGVILFQLITGDVPFRGNMSVLPQKVIHEDPPSPRRLNRYVPRDLETICLKCLEKDPARRYPSAKDLADELRRFFRDEPILARPLGWAGRLWRWRRRQPVVAAWIGISMVLLGLIAALAGWGFVQERALRREIERSAHSQQNLLLFVRSSDAVQRYRADVEEAANDSELVAALTTTDDDPEWRKLCGQLQRQPHDNPDRALRKQLVDHPLRQPLQRFIEQLHGKSDLSKVFAWFVQDVDGLQIAREPAEEENVGRNYAWRTYFHGGERDFENLAAWQTAGRPVIEQARLSADFRTEITNQEVVAVSAPVRRDGKVVGVVGVFLLIAPRTPSAGP